MLDVTSTNSTDIGSVETSVELLNDRINLIAATTLLGVTYGIMAGLYCMTAYSLLQKLFFRRSTRRSTRSGSYSNPFSRSRTDWRNTVFYLAYTTVLFVLATLYTAGNSQNAIVAYVDNRLYPGGPSQYYVLYMAGQTVMVMTDITAVLILWLTDALIVWRFVVIYYKVRYARWIIPLPCTMYVGVVVLSTLVLRGEAGLGRIFYLSENLLLAYYALSFSLNILATVLIAVRLYWHKIQLERAFGSAIDSPYMSIATMLIESAALYGVWSLMFLALSILQSPGQTIVLATISQIQVIAPLLIILWIARGKAWDHSKSHSEAEPHSTGVVELSFSRRDHAGSQLDVGHAHLDTNRSTSRSTVAGGDEPEHRDRDDNGNGIELGLYGSKPSILMDDRKA